MTELASEYIRVDSAIGNNQRGYQVFGGGITRANYELAVPSVGRPRLDPTTAGPLTHLLRR